MSKNNKFYQSPMSQNQQGYNGFDLSHSLQTTFSSGMIIPLDWHFCNPGDKFQVDEACVVKTTDLLKPSSTSGKFYVDHFFVPINVLDSFFGSKFYGLNLRESSALSLENLTNQLPCTNLSTIEDLLKENSPWPGDVFRLLDAMGVHIRYDSDGNPMFNRNRRISLYPFLAYQRVYNDYFRLTDWEAKDLASFNFDLHPGGFVSSVNSLIPLMQLRYAPLRPDYFNYYLPNPLQTSDISHGAPFAQTEDFKFLQNAVGLNLTQEFDDTDGGYGETNIGSTSVEVANSLTTSDGMNSPLAFINTANIRNLFAVEKLLEITRRAKKTYDMQTLAHFGVNPHSDDESFRVRRSVFDLNIGQVVSSATTSEGVLGERAGLGHGQKSFSGNSKFVAKKHGIYIVVAYFLPDVVYSVDGVTEKLGTVTTNQMYHPEFDRLGMEPFNLDELVGMPGSFGSQELTPYPISANFENDSQGYFRLLGWRPRYSSLKIAPNVVSGGIASGRSYKEWSPQIIPDWVNMQLYPNNIKYDYGHYLDSILVIPYNPSWPNGELSTKGNFSTVFDTDPFIFDTYLKIHKASKMSVNGLPSL